MAALGKKQDEIAELVVESYYDYDKEIFAPVTEEYLKLKEKYKLDENDLQALDDIYRLHVNNQRLKARLLLFQTLDESFSKEELIEKKKQRLKKVIARPEYWIKGERVSVSDWMQRFVCPADSEFPYDQKGKRTGIIFGFFRQDKEEPHFEIGRLEAEERDSTLDFAQTDEEVDKYVDLLSKQFRNIPFNEKRIFFWDYVQVGVTGEPKGIAEKIIKVLFDQEEKKKLLLEATPFWMKQFKIIEREVSQLNELFQDFGRLKNSNFDALDEYEKMIGLKRFEKLLDIKIKDIDKSFDDYVKKIRRKIKNLRAKAEPLEQAA